MGLELSSPGSPSQSGMPPHTRRAVRIPLSEFQVAPDVSYNELEALKYTTSSRIIEIQSRIFERALQLLALLNDGVPKLLLDIGCGSGLSGETFDAAWPPLDWL